jgi:hypothetical protein
VTQPSSTFFYNGVSTDNFDDDYQQEYYRVDGLLFQDFSIPLPVSEDEKVLPELLASLLNVVPHCLDDNDRSDDSTDDLPEELPNCSCVFALPDEYSTGHPDACLCS